MFTRPGTAPPSSPSSRADNGHSTDDQRPSKRTRAAHTQSPERQRGQIAKRGKNKKGRHTHGSRRRRAATEAGSDGDEVDVESSDEEEPPEDYQDLAKTKVTQLTEANKLAKNKLAVCELYAPLREDLLLISSTVSRGCNV